MRLLLLCLPIVILISCASPAPPPPTDAPLLADSRWQGDMNWRSSVPLDGASSGRYAIRLESCAGKIRIAIAPDGENFVTTTAKFVVVSGIDTHLFYFIQSSRPFDPAWVEVQTWSFTEREGGQADIQWSRSVNNRGSEPSYPLRSFGQDGRGMLKRVAGSC